VARLRAGDVIHQQPLQPDDFLEAERPGAAVAGQRQLDARLAPGEHRRQTNFFLVPNGAGNINVNNVLFGQTTSAYRDINSTNDSGARMIEFALRYRF
jgi:hypothetical protein